MRGRTTRTIGSPRQQLFPSLGCLRGMLLFTAILDRQLIRDLAAHIADIRSHLLRRRVPSLIEFRHESEASVGVPLLREMEKTVSLIPDVFSGSGSISEYLPLPSGDNRRSTVLS